MKYQLETWNRFVARREKRKHESLIMGIGHCKTSSVGHRLSSPPAVVSSVNLRR